MQYPGGSVSDMEQRKRRKEKKRTGKIGGLKKYTVITAAAFVYAVGVSLFVDPNNIAPGGVTGISIVANRLVPIGTGTLILLLNVPILLFAVWKFGLKMAVSTIYATALIAVFTNFLSGFPAATDDRLLASLAGGILSAVSIGVIFREGATTGGMDIVVKALRLKFPHLKTGNLFFAADAVVVTASALVFRDIDAALYAAIAATCTSLVLDIVLYGRDEAKLLYIISGRPEEIRARILAELAVGATLIEGRGAYSGERKQVLLCAVKKPVFPRVERIVREEDADSFLIVTSASEIFGEGYKSYFNERI